MRGHLRRTLNVHWVCCTTPLAVETAPFPVLRSPCQTALALPCMISLLESFEASERFVIQCELLLSVLSVVTLVAACFTQTARSTFLFTCHCEFFYRACDAASSIRTATSFGLET